MFIFSGKHVVATALLLTSSLLLAKNMQQIDELFSTHGVRMLATRCYA